MKKKVAIATGDPGGIGPEISLKATLDPAVQSICRPVLVGDREVMQSTEDGILMLFFEHGGREVRIAHVTLHASVRRFLEMISMAPIP